MENAVLGYGDGLSLVGEMFESNLLVVKITACVGKAQLPHRRIGSKNGSGILKLSCQCWRVME